MEDKSVNIVIFGPPGSGKGTQSEKISKNFNLKKISTGDLLRDEIKKKTDLGIKIKSIIDNGELVSDIIINKLVEKVISDSANPNKLIFDGYPRNLNQAKNLDLLLKKYSQNIACVISLLVDKEIIIKRILGRQICKKCGLIFNEYFKPSSKKNHKCGESFLEKRDDDTEEITKSRFDTYTKETFPLMNYYKKQNLLNEIHGKGEITQIYEQIRKIITSLEA